ncbi:MAG: hypothetical protein L0Z62_06005 [Gemmataceae bacterium]|nr:hypothetical protein [Gemmataceae bacterium]
MSLPTKTVDVSESEQKVSDFIRSLSPIRQPIQITLGGHVVARLVPPEELTEVEKAQILQAGWKLVERARACNQGVLERELARTVDAAVKRVRSGP